MANFVNAEFKTAYLQREVVEDTKVSSGTSTLKVGDVVSLTFANGVATAAPVTAVASVVVGNYIIAQSDMTMEYGHVPVENRDYAYSKDVALSTTAKKVAFFRINNLEDVKLTLVTRT